MIKINAMGDACPIPVVKTKKAIQELEGPGEVETLVDNEIAVKNLTKMAVQMGCEVRSRKLGEKEYQVTVLVKEGAKAPENMEVEACRTAAPAGKKRVAVFSSDKMGRGDDALGEALMKGFIYALGQQEELPSTLLFYNGGARLTCQDAPTLEDLRSLEARGVEILTCGTCLDHYGLKEKLQVGEVTNMYAIVEKMTGADLLVKP